MDKGIPLTSQPKTRAEYRAAIRAVLDEIHRLFAGMDQNHAEWERSQARIEAMERQADANLQALREQVERLRRTGQHDA